MFWAAYCHTGPHTPPRWIHASLHCGVAAHLRLSPPCIWTGLPTGFDQQNVVETLQLPFSPWSPETNQRAVKKSRMKCHVGGEVEVSQLNPVVSKPSTGPQNHEKDAAVMNCQCAWVCDTAGSWLVGPTPLPLHFMFRFLDSPCPLSGCPVLALTPGPYSSSPGPCGFPPGSPSGCHLFFTRIALTVLHFSWAPCCTLPHDSVG